jgi:hypothetical protein
MPQRLLDRTQRTQSYHTTTSELKVRQHDSQMNAVDAAPSALRPSTAPHLSSSLEIAVMDGPVAYSPNSKRPAPEGGKSDTMEDGGIIAPPHPAAYSRAAL